MAKLPVRGTVSLGDLPTELIEIFAEYLGSETISKLKLVSKRFYKVFTNDRFFQNYLSYPEHYYKCIMKSEATAHGAGEIVDNVKNGQVGRWKGYLQLEKSIIDNCRKGKFDTYDELPFPPSRNSSELKALHQTDFEIDYRYEHWLLCRFFMSFEIFLFNITAKPKLVATFDLGMKANMFNAKLLPDQVFMPVKDGRYDVYNIVRDDNADYALMYSYSFDDSADKSGSCRCLYSEILPLSLFTVRNFVIITSRDNTTSSGSTIFIGYSTLRNGPAELAALQIWDLKSGLKVGKVTLGEHRIWQRFVSAHNDVEVYIFEGEFPSVIVLLYSREKSKVQITLFNVVKMVVTLLLEDELHRGEIDDEPLCGMYLNYLYVDTCSVFSLYLLESLHTGDPESSKNERLLLRIERPFNIRPIMFVGNNKIVMCNSLYNDDSTPSSSSSTDVNKQLFVTVINTSSSEFCKHSFSLANFEAGDIVSFVQPNLLVMRDIKYDEDSNTRTFTTKVFDTDGREMCSCENLKPLMGIQSVPRRLHQNQTPSVIVCESVDGASIRLYRF